MRDFEPYWMMFVNMCVFYASKRFQAKWDNTYDCLFIVLHVSVSLNERFHNFVLYCYKTIINKPMAWTGNRSRVCCF